MILIISLIVGALGLFYKYLVSTFGYWEEKGVPYPKPYPLAGSFPKSFFKKRNIVHDFQDVYMYVTVIVSFLKITEHYFFKGNIEAQIDLLDTFKDDNLTFCFSIRHWLKTLKFLTLKISTIMILLFR